MNKENIQKIYTGLSRARGDLTVVTYSEAINEIKNLMRIKKLLLRLGSEKLIKLIDNDIFKILQLRKNKISSSKNLAELVLQLNSEKTILSEKTSRDIIIDALKVNEAELIGKLLILNREIFGVF